MNPVTLCQTLPAPRTPKGLYRHGNQRPSDITQQVWRETHKLNDRLQGQFVFPLLVFMGEVTGEKAKGIPCPTLEDLKGWFGKVGEHFYHLARAEDERPVESEREAKSISSEMTFEQETSDIETLKKELKPLSLQVAERLAKAGLEGRTVMLKVKYANFKSITRSHTLELPLREANDLEKEAQTLLEQLELATKVRLLGVGVAKLSPSSSKHHTCGAKQLFPALHLTHPEDT
jgi:impB/mucB/samB family C-terminal domain